MPLNVDAGLIAGGISVVETLKQLTENNSLISDKDFYEFEGKQIIPSSEPYSNYYGAFEKNNHTFHLYSMVEIYEETLQDSSRPGKGFYLGSFKEENAQLILVDLVNVETTLNINLITDYDFNYQEYENFRASQIPRAINGLSEYKVNILLFNYVDSSPQIKNTFVSFDVTINDDGKINIQKFTDRKSNDPSTNNYENILQGYIIDTTNENSFGKELIYNNSHIFYFLVYNENENRNAFISYNLKTNVLNTIVENLQTWWESNTNIPFDISFKGSRIIVKSDKPTIWAQDNTINSGLGFKTYFLEFNPDKITQLGIENNDFSRTLISENKIFLITKY